MKEYINVPGFPENVRFTPEMRRALTSTELATCAVKLNMLADGDEEALEEITGKIADIRGTDLTVDEMSVVLDFLRDLPENQPVIEVES